MAENKKKVDQSWRNKPRPKRKELKIKPSTLYPTDIMKEAAIISIMQLMKDEPKQTATTASKHFGLSRSTRINWINQLGLKARWDQHIIECSISPKHRAIPNKIGRQKKYTDSEIILLVRKVFDSIMFEDLDEKEAREKHHIDEDSMRGWLVKFPVLLDELKGLRIWLKEKYKIEVDFKRAKELDKLAGQNFLSKSLAFIGLWPEPITLKGEEYGNELEDFLPMRKSLLVAGINKGIFLKMLGNESPLQQLWEVAQALRAQGQRSLRDTFKEEMSAKAVTALHGLMTAGTVLTIDEEYEQELQDGLDGTKQWVDTKRRRKQKRLVTPDLKTIQYVHMMTGEAPRDEPEETAHSGIIHYGKFTIAEVNSHVDMTDDAIAKLEARKEQKRLEIGMGESEEEETTSYQDEEDMSHLDDI